MDEERSGIQKFNVVDLLPLVGCAPCRVAFADRRVRRRPEGQHVQQQSFVISLPTIIQESAFRSPALADRGAFVLSPLPIREAVHRVSKLADFAFVRRIAVEVHGCCQGAGKKKRGINGRKLALPGAAARVHVKKVIIKSAVSGGIRLGALRAVREKP